MLSPAFRETTLRPTGSAEERSESTLCKVINTQCKYTYIYIYICIIYVHIFFVLVAC